MASNRVVIVLFVFAIIALVRAINQGNDEPVNEELIYINNHTSAVVQILRTEEVEIRETPLEINVVVVYIYLSGLVDTLQGEQRKERGDFLKLFHKFELEFIQTTSPNFHQVDLGLY